MEGVKQNISQSRDRPRQHGAHSSSAGPLFRSALEDKLACSGKLFIWPIQIKYKTCDPKGVNRKSTKSYSKILDKHLIRKYHRSHKSRLSRLPHSSMTPCCLFGRFFLLIVSKIERRAPENRLLPRHKLFFEGPQARSSALLRASRRLASSSKHQSNQIKLRTLEYGRRKCVGWKCVNAKQKGLSSRD